MRGALTMEEKKTSIILLLRIKKEGAPRRDQPRIRISNTKFAFQMQFF